MDPQLLAFIRNSMISAGTAIALKYGLDASFVPAAVGGIMTVIGFGWSALGHTRNGTISAAAALPEVKAVLAAPAIANSDLFLRNNKVITVAQSRGLATHD
ncbi:MAG: hypothetical protein C5B60_10290 [Chloroflexi bacterium]|nr:MAG: hypothetical protein C5B60_10290 [Chloroflexota bacterium]